MNRASKACMLALATKAHDFLKSPDSADFLRAARALSLHFPRYDAGRCLGADLEGRRGGRRRCDRARLAEVISVSTRTPDSLLPRQRSQDLKELAEVTRSVRAREN